MELRVRSLAASQVRRFRTGSSSRPGLDYELTVDHAGDVTCGCPGFEYRGMCSHARELKTAVGKGSALPAAFTEVVSNVEKVGYGK